MYALILEGVEDITDSIATYHFRTTRPVQYLAGQFIELTIPHDNPDERGTRHWFTLSSSPSETHLSITTRFATQHDSSYKHALRALKPGTELLASDPMGDFVLPINPATPLVFIAGGVGITPIRSMVKWLHDNKERRNIQLLYAAKEPEDFIFHDLFTAYGLTPTYIARHAPDTWNGERDTLTAARILELAQSDTNTLFYISGPEPMVEHLTKDLANLNINPLRIVSDYFPGYPSV